MTFARFKFEKKYISKNGDNPAVKRSLSDVVDNICNNLVNKSHRLKPPSDTDGRASNGQRVTLMCVGLAISTKQAALQTNDPISPSFARLNNECGFSKWSIAPPFPRRVSRDLTSGSRSRPMSELLVNLALPGMPRGTAAIGNRSPHQHSSPFLRLRQKRRIYRDINRQFRAGFVNYTRNYVAMLTGVVRVIAWRAHTAWILR